VLAALPLLTVIKCRSRNGGWPSRGTYEITGQEVVAEGADLRVQVLTLDAGQAIVPWHYHSEIIDQSLRLEQNDRVQWRRRD